MAEVTVYMKVTNDKYRLPIAFAESPKQLAKLTGNTAGTISSQCARNKNHNVDTSFIKVVIEDD